MKSSTIAPIFVKHLIAGAKDQGFDVDSLLLEQGISPYQLDKERIRVTFRQLSNLSLRLVEEMQDEQIGLGLKPQPPNTFKMMMYSVINASNVGHALHILAEFSNMMQHGLHYTVIKTEQIWTLKITAETPKAIKNSYLIENLFSIFHRLLCWMANRRLNIQLVSVDYPEPCFSDEYRYVFYGAPVEYECGYYGIQLLASDCNFENTRNFDDVKTLLAHMPFTLLSQTIDEHNMSQQVRRYIERQLLKHKRLATIEETSQHFNLHPQTLRRQLQQEQTSFTEIKTQTRRDLAIHSLLHSDQSIETIADQLDFSEASAFVRAFKTWSGVTPLNYKKLYKDE